MHEPREYEGYWWLPDDPDKRIAGTLSFSQDDVRLRLLGSFQEMRPGPISLDDVPRILGSARERTNATARAITLESNRGLGQNFGSQFQTSAYGPHTVLVGAWYEGDEEVLFDELSIRYSDLDTWAAASGFQHEMHFDETKTSLTRLEVTYTPPPRIEVELDADTTLSIAWRWTWGGLRPVTTESRLGQEAVLGLAFARGATLARCLEYVFQLRNFLSLGVGRPIRVLSVGGWHHLPPEQHPPESLAVEVLYQLIGTPPEPRRELLPEEMLFNLADAQARLEGIFRAWFSGQEALGPVFNRYFYIVHGDHIAREIQFESFVRALETHHRRTTHGTELPESAHQVRLRQVLESAPTSDREWLERNLRYSNELDLPTRLRQTLDRCPLVASRLIGNSKRRESFVRKVAATRNYEIHLDPRNERSAITDARIMPLIFQLRALVEMTLLLDLGFRCEEVDSIFERTRRYHRIEEIKAQVAGRTS